MAEPGGGSIVLHLPTGTYLRMDRTGAEILDLLVAGPEHATAGLMERHGIDRAQAEQDVATVQHALDQLGRSPGRPVRRPTVAGVSSVAGEWLHLPPLLRRRVLVLAGLLGAIELGLRLADLATVARWARCPLETTDAGRPMPPIDLGLLGHRERIGLEAVDWLLRRWIADGTCLRRALLGAGVLRRRRPRLRLGLMPDGATAHAWIEGPGWALGAGAVDAVFAAPGARVEPEPR